MGCLRLGHMFCFPWHDRYIFVVTTAQVRVASDAPRAYIVGCRAVGNKMTQPLNGSCIGDTTTLDLRVSIDPPPSVVRSNTNVPVCILKEQSERSCSVGEMRSGNPVAARDWLQRLHLFMADAVGGWSFESESVPWNKTSTTFGFPRGVRHVTGHRHANHELGRDQAWLPVTRTKTQQDGHQVGLWFHYHRGCSDTAWNVGRTLLVRNKCHAIVLLEQRAWRCSWRAAVHRVASKLAAAVKRRTFGIAVQHYTSNISIVDAPLCLRETQLALDRCARDEFDGIADTMPSLVRAIITTSALDYVGAATLADDLSGRNDTFDTIQFANGDEGIVELWDVRALQGLHLPTLRAQAKTREHEIVSSQAGRLVSNSRWIQEAWGATAWGATAGMRSRDDEPRWFRRLNGSPCNLSLTWSYCFACNDSETERSCLFKCALVGRGRFAFKPYPMNLSARGNSYSLSDIDSVGYGLAWHAHALPPAVVGLMEGAGVSGGALTLASIWVWLWGSIVTSVPPSETESATIISQAHGRHTPYGTRRPRAPGASTPGAVNE